tara:strand:+ start:274 stop:711 length:438 start_codon:yes stop_codon:yes gene_type:complete
VLKEKDTEKLLALYSGIKTELATVYITSSGGTYLKEMDAISAEAQIQRAKESRQIREDRMTKLVDILVDVLKENNWGVFYKSEPIQTLTLQNDAPLLKINEVDEDIVEEAINKMVMSLNNDYLKNWKNQEHTAPPSQDDSKQTKS